jgi:hypothetical protein
MNDPARTGFPLGSEITLPSLFWSRFMIRRLFPLIVSSGPLALLLAGCGSDGGTPVTLAEGGGVVTFKGAPLADATVTFIPVDGPIATGVTDLSGKFKLATGSRPGVAVGQCTVTVSANTGGGTPGTAPAASLSGPVTSKAEGEKRAAEMAKMQAQMSRGGGDGAMQEVMGSGGKSIIPEKYGKADTSDLLYTVAKDASKNDFKIELKE